ncbi:MAG: DUF167 domain-containing protein [Candidatus Yanofskybacteria bacterium]|nr:DUF167 domain-containing protein [Candidatus Yanofskybacteria bacterium]
MKFHVLVKPRSKKEEVKKLDEAHFEVRVGALPKEGEANDAVIKALAGYLDIPKSRIRIKSGTASRRKIISID